ncbi:MAG: hypothetical protein INR72_17120 [Williamsia herbipolensis]|nr:hypothetical protein [Williamsia herbipolensis]
MCNLHDIDRCESVASGVGHRQATLRRGVQVAEHEARRTARACSVEPDDHARVVPGLHVAGRPEHSPRLLAESTGRAGRRPSDVDTGVHQRPDDTFVRRAGRRSDQRRDDVPGDHVDRSDVVAVEVGEDEQVDAVDGEHPEARLEHLRLVADVHQSDRPGAPHEHGIALPDVARRDRPIGRDARPDHHGRDDDGRDADGGHCRRADEQPGPSRPPSTVHQERDRDEGRDDRCRDDADDPAGPRE